MIPNIPQQGPTHHIADRRGANGPEMPSSAAPTPVAGKANAPGQIAKTMIAEATANGAELPAFDSGDDVRMVFELQIHPTAKCANHKTLLLIFNSHNFAHDSR